MAYVELAYIHNFNLGRKSKSIRNAQIAQIRTHAARVTRSRAKVTKADTFADCHDVTGGTDHRTGEDAEQLVPQGVFFHAGLGPTNGDFFNVLSTGDHENVRQAIAGWTRYPENYRFYDDPCRLSSILSLAAVTTTDPLVYLLTIAALLQSSTESTAQEQVDAQWTRGVLSRRALPLKLCETNPPSSSLVLMCCGAAVSRIRQRVGLQEPQHDPKLVFMVALMAMHESRLGHQDLSDLHWTSFVRLVKMRHGRNVREPLGLHLKAMEIIFVARAPSVSTLASCPVLPAYDDTVVPTLPAGFGALLSEGLTKPVTSMAISRAVSILWNDAHGPNAGQARYDQRWTYEKYMEACICLSYPILSLDRFICLALMLLRTMMCRSNMVGRYLVYMSRLQLSMYLKDMQKSSSASWRCLVWLYIVTMEAWRDLDESILLKEGLVLLKEMKKRFGSEVERWSDVETVLGGFLWTDQLSEWWNTRWQVLWEMV